MIRRYSCVCVAVAALSLGAGESRAQHDDPHALIAHRIATVAAVEALPDSIRAFFRGQQTALVEAAANPVAERAHQGTPKLDAAHHVVWLDLEAPHGTAQQRLDAAQAFPYDEAKAKQLMRRLSVHGAGFLPWTLERAVATLEDAFRDGDPATIVSAAGTVTHLAVDASQPFQTTRLGNWDEVNRARRAYADALADYEPRLTDEVRVSPLRFRAVENIGEEIFHTLLKTHECAVLDFAPWFATEPSNQKVSQPPVRRCITSADDVPDCLEQRIEAGAQLAARLIGTAWIHANLPSLPDATTAERSAPVEPKRPLAKSQAPTPEDRAPLIGSRNSKIVHRADCPHVARIKPSNRAGFPTVEAAKRAGRRPCRSCKPWIEPDGP